MIRRLLALWHRARCTGRDLDWTGVSALVAGALMLLTTGVIGPAPKSTLTACDGCGKTAVAAKD